MSIDITKDSKVTLGDLFATPGRVFYKNVYIDAKVARKFSALDPERVNRWAEKQKKEYEEIIETLKEYA